MGDIASWSAGATRSQRYRAGSVAGRSSIATSQALRSPGRFEITATGVQVTGADLAIGGSIVHGIVAVVLSSVPLMILGILGGVVVFIVRLIGKRSAGPAFVQRGVGPHRGQRAS